MEFNNEASINLENEMQRLAQTVVDKGYESAYCVHGLNQSPSFLEMLRKHVTVTHKDRPYPMFPVRLTGAVCGMYRTGALFASFDIDIRGNALSIYELRLSIRDDDDRLTDTSIKLRRPEEIPPLKSAKEMMIAKQKWIKRQLKRKIKRGIG